MRTLLWQRRLAEETIAEPLIDLWIEALTSGFFWIATCASRYLRSLDNSWRPLRASRCERKLESLSDARDNDGRRELLWWLFTYHRAREEWERAISYCIDLFELAPTEDIQSALLNAAERGGCLDQVRKDTAPVEREQEGFDTLRDVACAIDDGSIRRVFFLGPKTLCELRGAISEQLP